MSEDDKYDRRRFMGTAAMTVAAAQLGAFSPAAKSEKVNATIKPLANTSFAPLSKSKPARGTLVTRKPDRLTAVP